MNDLAPHANPGFDKSNLIRYFIYAYAFSWLIWGIAVWGTNYSTIDFTNLTIPIIIIGAFGPTAAAFWLTYRNGEKGATMRFLKRGLLVRTIPLWVWGAMFVVPALAWTISMFVVKTSGSASFASDSLLLYPLTILIMIIGGPLQEEFGWRGYALDRMQSKWNSFTASLILGLIWAAWHLPLFYIAGSAQQGIDLRFYFVSVVGISILITWFYNNSKASIFAAIISHALSTR